MMEQEKIRFVLKGLQLKILEKVNLMDNRTLEKLRINITKIEATSFLLGQSLRERGPSISSEKDEIWELRRQMYNLEGKLKMISSNGCVSPCLRCFAIPQVQPVTHSAVSSKSGNGQANC
ncbi:hypothetical protein Trydic_g15198 [Trypoxylus dichotomus]